MHKHTITTPARRRSATVPRRRLVPLSAQDRWLVLWHLKRGIVRPRLVALTLLLIWSLVAWLVLEHLLHAWPLVLAVSVPPVESAWPTPTPVPSVAQRVPVLYPRAIQPSAGIAHSSIRPGGRVPVQQRP